tara:strand:- start:1539 stop:1709 length:171 start_codon:yes stop_codon:yes gene_type:complete
MPGKSMCNKIKDPKKRADCKAYKGEYASMKPQGRSMDNNGKRKKMNMVMKRNSGGY